MNGQPSENTYKLINCINSVNDLNELADVLNEITESLSDDECGIKLDELVDLTSLPKFNSTEREWVEGSFSCDDTSDLFYNDCAGDICGRVGWEVVELED